MSGYIIYRADEEGGEFATVDSSVTSTFVDTALSQQTTYYYQVQAFDAEGNIGPRSETAEATTGGVEMPAHVRLVAATPSNPNDRPVVTITWTASKGAILHYEVQRTTVANSTRDGDYTEILPHEFSTTRDDNTVCGRSTSTTVSVIGPSRSGSRSPNDLGRGGPRGAWPPPTRT